MNSSELNKRIRKMSEILDAVSKYSRFLNNDKRYDFKVDLDLANIRECQFLEILNEKFIELKTEVGEWQKTENLFFEIKSNGKPSGVMASTSDFWVHELRSPKTDNTIAYIVFPTKILKSLIKIQPSHRYRTGCGEGGRIEGCLIPLKEIFDYWINEEKDNG